VPAGSLATARAIKSVLSPVCGESEARPPRPPPG
jgi:hypothetical protein